LIIEHSLFIILEIFNIQRSIFNIQLKTKAMTNRKPLLITNS